MSKHGAIKLSTLIITALLLAAALPASEAARPEGTLTVAVATFGNERWLPHLYVGAEDIVLKPLWENLISRDPKTGELIPMLAERWQITDGGRTWKFQLRKGVHFHDGRELTAEDVKFTFSSIAREGSANSLSTEFRLIKSMEIESRYAITIHFDKPSVVFANKVNQGLFASVAFIQSKSSIESAGEEGAERRAQPDLDRARKVRLALNLAVDKNAVMERVMGNLGSVTGSWLAYPNDPWTTDALKKPYPYDPARAKALLSEAGYPKGFDVTMNLTAWPGRGYLPDVGAAVATYWEKIGIRVKRRPVDRAVFAADFRARAYPGVTVAYASPVVGPELWDNLIRISHSKAAVQLFIEHPKLDDFLDRLATEPSYDKRVKIMRDEMGPWMYDYVPAVAIGAAHNIAAVGPKVGDWPLIPGHMGFHNWEYVTRKP